jgi:hypothetical protein
MNSCCQAKFRTALTFEGDNLKVEPTILFTLSRVTSTLIGRTPLRPGDVGYYIFTHLISLSRILCVGRQSV